MPTDDALFFMDANKYLDLYRMETVKDLLITIEGHSRCIFVTRLVADEVERNKLEVATRFFRDSTARLKARCIFVIQQDIDEPVLELIDQEKIPRLETYGVPDQFGQAIEAF